MIWVICLTFAIIVCTGLAAIAGDASLPKHMTVIFENARVRVLEANLAPGEKSEPVELRDAVVVPLSDYEIRFIAADGTSQTGERKTGVPVWAPVSPPVSEVSNKPADAIVVEIKCSGLGEPLKTGDR